MNHVEEARLDAEAFRNNTVYTSDGDPVRLSANADRLEWYAEKMRQDGEYISYLVDRHDRLQQEYDDQQGSALLAVTICSTVTLVIGFAFGVLVQAVLVA